MAVGVKKVSFGVDVDGTGTGVLKFVGGDVPGVFVIL